MGVPHALEKVRQMRMKVLLATLALGCSWVDAATMAYTGKIMEVQDPAEEELKHTLRKFAVKIDYYDYCSRGKFGRASKVGEMASQKVMPRGTLCVLNGELMNAGTFAKALRPGLWGYVYEDTWQSFYTGPDFTWGEILKHDPEAGTVTLRVHRTHKEVHLAANPPVEKAFKYDGATTVRLEEKGAEPEEAFKPGNWLQVHSHRKGMIDVRTRASRFDAGELLPQAEGRRGFANDLSGPVEILSVETENPGKVIDNRVRIVVRRNGEEEKIACRSTTFILDGKLCPPSIAARPGRRAILCYYRNQTSPHKVLLTSVDHRVNRSLLRDLRISDPGDRRMDWLLDGQPVSGKQALKQADALAEATIQAPRGRAMIAFAPIVVDR